ncbi:MAG: tryptophan synthase subunit alpha [Actinomycetota bacterium]
MHDPVSEKQVAEAPCLGAESRMNRIDRKFAELKKENKVALIPYIMAGYPTLKASQKIVEALVAGGADMVEIGIPYSDPLSDGTTIQKASEKALSQGTTTKSVFALVEQIRKELNIPIILMTYYNTIFRYSPKSVGGRSGLDAFAREASKAGADGVIAPDLPPEEASSWRKVARGQGLDTIFLLAPTSTKERIKRVARASEGFVYCVSLTGVTGARKRLPIDIPQFLNRVREETSKPLAVGFGVSTPAQAGELSPLCDGIIIGSALIDAIDKEKSLSGMARAAEDFVSKFQELISLKGEVE